jgi:hypothetical protein
MTQKHQDQQSSQHFRLCQIRVYDWEILQRQQLTELTEFFSSFAAALYLRHNTRTASTSVYSSSSSSGGTKKTQNMQQSIALILT